MNFSKFLKSLCSTILITCCLIAIPAYTIAVTFNDLNISPFKESVLTLTDRGVLSGYPDGTFRPRKLVNRAELTKMVVLARGVLPDPNIHKNCFPDVTNQWFAQYVCNAKDNGWVNGYPDGSFKPEKNINYVESLKIILESFSFRPIEKTNPWYDAYISLADNYSIGFELGGGENLMARDEIAELLVRTLKANGDIP